MTLLLLIAAALAQDVSIFVEDDGVVFSDLINNVRATYNRSINETGWNFLTIKCTASRMPENRCAYGMGYLEGYLTQKDIDTYYSVFVKSTWKKGIPPSEITEKLREQREYWRENAQRGSELSKEQKFVDSQFRGLYDGYVRAGGNLTEDDMYLMTSRGDLFEILNMCPENVEVNSFHDLRKKYGKEAIHSCSAFIKNVNGTVYFAHNTWTMYTRMMRIKKVYDYVTSKGNVIIEQTSYPGILVSIDDYYALRNKEGTKFIMETTNNVYDETKYLDFTKTFLYWQRVLNAFVHGVSTNGIVTRIGHMQSGTYNNQWMIFDTTLSSSGKQKTKNGSLIIMEEMLDEYRTHDVTEHLLSEDSQYAWTSYNIPYDDHIRNVSGLMNTEGCVPYRDSRRAIMFRRDISKVNTLESAKKYIRYNDYLNDELSAYTPECDFRFNSTENKNPLYAIAARGDLIKGNELYGAIDGKVMSTDDIYTMHIISGPSNEYLKTFSFSERGLSIAGIPDKYEFDWVETNPYNKYEDIGKKMVITSMCLLVLIMVI